LRKEYCHEDQRRGIRQGEDQKDQVNLPGGYSMIDTTGEGSGGDFDTTEFRGVPTGSSMTQTIGEVSVMKSTPETRLIAPEKRNFMEQSHQEC
jgi:hypothetical protein